MRIAMVAAAFVANSIFCGESTAPRNATLYLVRNELFTADDVQRLAPDAKISADKQGQEWSKLTVAWPGLQMTLNRAAASTVRQQIPGLQGYAYELAGKKMDALVYSVIQKAGRVKNLVGVVAEPAFDSGGKIKRVLNAIAEKELALVFFENALCTPDFKVILGPGNVREAGAKVALFDSALRRREKTMARLKGAGITTPDHLPPVPAEEEIQLRSNRDVSRRCVTLAILAARGEGFEKAKTLALVEKYKLAEVLSPKERAFIEKDVHTEVERIQFTWRYECVQVLLWAMKRVDRLDLPAKPCDAATCVKAAFTIADKDEFNTVSLRNKAEILDQLDLVFRAHWAARNARLKKEPAPAGIDGGVAQEWHHALNWLTQAGDAEWDNVDTGT